MQDFFQRLASLYPAIVGRFWLTASVIAALLLFSVTHTASAATPPAPGPAPLVYAMLPMGMANNQKPAISAKYSGGGSAINQAAVSLLVDGAEVGAKAVKSATGIEYVPALPLADGTHRATLSIATVAGTKATSTWEFSIDSQAPLIVQQLPAGAIPAPATTAVTAQFTDTGGSGVPPSLVLLIVDGKDVSTLAARTSSSVKYSPLTPFGQGSHSIALTVKDGAGNSTSSSWTFTVNSVGATIGAVAPAADALLGAADMPLVSAEFKAGASPVNQSKTRFELDGANILPVATVTPGSVAFTPARQLVEGDHVARLSLTDLNGVTTTKEWRFRTATAPVISDQTPYDMFVEPRSMPVIQASFSDIGAGIDSAKTQLKFEGVDVTSHALVSAAGIRYTVESPLADGSHKVELTIADLAGNPASSSWFIGTATPPQILSFSPKGEHFTSGTRPVIRATYRDPGGAVDPGRVRLVLNGEDITNQAQIGPSALEYTPTMPLAAGSYSVYLQVTNAAASIANELWSFEVADEKTYAVNITSPGGPSNVTSQQLTVTAVAIANSSYPTQMTVNGLRMEAMGPGTDGGVAYTGNVELKDGTNTLTVLAQFADGKSASANLEVGFDAPAVLTFTSPQDRSVLGRANDTSPRDLTGEVERPVTLTGTSSKPLQKVTINQQQAKLSGDGLQFSFPNFFLHEGNNVLTALGTDRSGRTSSAAINVSVDQSAPLLNVEYPRTGHTTRAAWINVRGMVNDAVEAVFGAPEPTLTVNGKAAVVADRFFQATAVPLQPGLNTLVVRAVDHLGNAREQTVKVTRADLGIGGLVMAAGDQQSASANTQLPVALKVLALSASGEPLQGLLVNFNVMRGTGSLAGVSVPAGTPVNSRPLRELQVKTDGNGVAQAWFTTGTQSGPGANAVQVLANGSPEEIVFTASTSRGRPARINADAGTNQIAETGVPVMEILSAVVRDVDNNLLPGVPVQFQVEEGDAAFVGADGQALAAGAPLIVMTDKNGVAAARPVMGTTGGLVKIGAAAAQPGSSDFGLGAVHGASFVVRSRAAQDGMASFIGTLYNDKGQALAGARISIGRTALSATTGADGSFALNDVPPGRIDLFIDGRTINPTNDPAHAQYPSLHFEAFVVKGQVNQLAHPLYLPALLTGTAQRVGGDKDVILTIPGLEGFEMKVRAHSVTFPDGSREGTLVVSPVAADRLPMAPPQGAAQFGVPAWTIQPAGTRFDPPIEIQMPNATGELPGANLPVVQWDHDLGQYVPMGRATVKSNGAFLVTDPGCGLTKAGWGGLVRSDNCRTAVPAQCPDCKTFTQAVCPTCIADPSQDKKKCDGDECKVCKNGKCVRKPDEEKGSVEQKIDLQVLSRYVDGIAQKLEAILKFPVVSPWISSLEIGRPTITGALTETLIERCCGGKPTNGVKLTGTIDFSPASISARIRPPTWRIPDPFDPRRDLAGIGMVIEGKAGIAGSGSGIKAECDCAYAVSVGGMVRLTVAAYLDLNSPRNTMGGAPIPASPRLLDVQGGVTAAAKAGAKLDCNGFSPSSYSLGPFELIVKIKAGDFIEKSVKIPLGGSISGP